MPTPPEPTPNAVFDPGDLPEVGPTDAAGGEAFARLVAVMRVLRAPGGCPWDAEQDLGTLRTYLIEEAYEVLEAMDALAPGTGDAAANARVESIQALREELGDLVLQVVFQARVAEEQGWFTIADVSDSITRKLHRRHPHVFGEQKADGSAAALANWEAMKAAEKGAGGKRRRTHEGTPRNAPALVRALRIGEKSAAVGFDWPDVEDIRAKMNEELLEMDRAVRGGDPAEMEHEIGDVLFVVSQYARRLGVEPETALRGTIDRFLRRFAYVEDRLVEQSTTPREATLEQMDLLWEEAKRVLATKPEQG